MLQLSIDWLKLENALELLHELEAIVDIAEIGTPMLFEYGLDAVARVKEEFPHLTVLADMKIMDAGAEESKMALEKKADIITAMASAKDATILAAAQAAHNAGKKIMVDMLGIQKIDERARQLDQMGIDFICLHTAFDMKLAEQRPVEDLERISRFISLEKIAVAGGITLKEIDSIVALCPHIVIVGGGILDQTDIPAVTRRFYEKCGERALRRQI